MIEQSEYGIQPLVLSKINLRKIIQFQAYLSSHQIVHIS